MSDLRAELQDVKGRHPKKYAFPDGITPYCPKCGNTWPCDAAKLAEALEVVVEQLRAVHGWVSADLGQNGPGPSGGYTTRVKHVAEALTKVEELIIR